MKPHLKNIIAALIFVLAAGTVIFYFTSMREVKSYGQGACQAFMPECGVCPGEIIDAKCYVKRGTFEQYP